MTWTRWSCRAVLAAGTAEAKARADAQIATLQTRLQAAQQEWERRFCAAAAAQDLKTGASEAHSHLRQARENTRKPRPNSSKQEVNERISQKEETQ